MKALISAPAVLLMDEPLSGLDAANCRQVCSTLKHLLTQLNIALVMVIHTPPAEMTHYFDDFILYEKGGRLLLQGADFTTLVKTEPTALLKTYYSNAKYHPSHT